MRPSPSKPSGLLVRLLGLGLAMGCSAPLKLAPAAGPGGDTADSADSADSGSSPGPRDSADSGPGPHDSADTGTDALLRPPSVEGLPVLEVLPVDGAILDSGFGPRRISSDGYRTDFHPGLDLDAPVGSAVRAVDSAVVHRIDDADTNDATIVLAHSLATPILFHGETIDVWYARYLHLQSIRVAEGDRLAAGAVIATVGSTDEVVEPHAHFEVRLGTWCSRAYSIENPDSGCARSYDPAVNPLHLLPLADPELFVAQVEQARPLQVRVTVREGDFDLNRIEAGGFALDFDTREGIDARSTEAIDSFEYGWVSIDPVRDSAEPDHQSWVFTFADGIDQADFYDITGVGLRVVP